MSFLSMISSLSSEKKVRRKSSSILSTICMSLASRSSFQVINLRRISKHWKPVSGARFEWGLIADIQSPDYETRMAILRKKEELDGLDRYHIPDEVMQYIANNIKSNIRELEGSLNKLIALSNLENKPIDISLAAEALKDMISPDNNRPVTPELIIDIVSEHLQYFRFLS